MNVAKLVVASAVGVAVASLFVALLASGSLVSSRTLSSSGVVATANLGVFTDSACTQSLASIDWGTISPGESVSRIVYVKNMGNAQLILSLTATDWNPSSANGLMTLGWNRQGQSLSAGQVAAASLVLSISSSASSISSFGMNIVITGSI